MARESFHRIAFRDAEQVFHLTSNCVKENVSRRFEANDKLKMEDENEVKNDLKEAGFFGKKA